MTEQNITSSNGEIIIDNCRQAPNSPRENSYDKSTALYDTYASRVSGQHLAGSGALVFEGELLEFPQWGSRAA